MHQPTRITVNADDLERVLRLAGEIEDVSREEAKSRSRLALKLDNHRNWGTPSNIEHRGSDAPPSRLCLDLASLNKKETESWQRHIQRWITACAQYESQYGNRARRDAAVRADGGA